MYGVEAAEGVRQKEQSFGQTSLPVQVVGRCAAPGPADPLPDPCNGRPQRRRQCADPHGDDDLHQFRRAGTITPPSASQVADVTSQAIQQAKASSG